MTQISLYSLNAMSIYFIFHINNYFTCCLFSVLNRLGRRLTIAVCSFIAVCFAIICAFSTSFAMFIVARLFVATGIAGCYNTAFVLCKYITTPFVICFNFSSNIPCSIFEFLRKFICEELIPVLFFPPSDGGRWSRTAVCIRHGSSVWLVFGFRVPSCYCLVA